MSLFADTLCLSQEKKKKCNPQLTSHHISNCHQSAEQVLHQLPRLLAVVSKGKPVVHYYARGEKAEKGSDF